MYAFTELHNDYPAFVNLSEQPDGTMKLTVRTRGDGGRHTAAINLAPDVAEELADAIYKHVYASEAEAPSAPAVQPDDALDAKRHRYTRLTTTAIRDPETGERIEITPEMYDAAIDRAMARDPDAKLGIKAKDIAEPAPVAQASQQPVAWMLPTGHGNGWRTTPPEGEFAHKWTPLFAAPLQQAEGALGLLIELNDALRKAWDARELPASVISGDLTRRVYAAIAASKESPAQSQPAGPAKETLA